MTPRHQPSFLWFTREGKAYLVTDAATLERVGTLHAEPRVRPAGAGDEETVGERLRQLADELVSSGAARPFDR